MLFQYLCGFKPVFYSTHSDDEPVKYGDLNDFRVSKGVPFDISPFFIRYAKKVSKSVHISRKTLKICLKTKNFVAPDKKI